MDRVEIIKKYEDNTDEKQYDGVFDREFDRVIDFFEDAQWVNLWLGPLNRFIVRLEKSDSGYNKFIGKSLSVFFVYSLYLRDYYLLLRNARISWVSSLSLN